MEQVKQAVFTLDTNVLIGYLNDDKKITEKLLAGRRENKKFLISVITEVKTLVLGQ